ncbi:hypothetical protein ACJX0J_027569, partial [Zea mays]
GTRKYLLVASNGQQPIDFLKVITLVLVEFSLLTFNIIMSHAGTPESSSEALLIQSSHINGIGETVLAMRHLFHCAYYSLKNVCIFILVLSTFLFRFRWSGKYITMFATSFEVGYKLVTLAAPAVFTWLTEHRLKET